VSQQLVASVTLGRDQFPLEETYTALTFQASLELLTKIESFFAPLGPLAAFHVLIAPKTKRISQNSLSLAPNASKQAIEALINSVFPS